MSIRLGVVGSRDFPSALLVFDTLDAIAREVQIDCVVSGGARGVDRMGEEWAGANGFPVVSFRPRQLQDRTWVVDRYHFDPVLHHPKQVKLPGVYPSFAAAAFVRNGFIVEFADGVVAFWDGHSRGTKDSIDRAREAGNLLDIVRA
jgi:hypothetical protein